jgi:hypothetical protein
MIIFKVILIKRRLFEKWSNNCIIKSCWENLTNSINEASLMSIFSLIRNIRQGSREQDLQGKFKTNKRRSCSDIVTNLSNIGGLKPG